MITASTVQDTHFFSVGQHPRFALRVARPGLTLCKNSDQQIELFSDPSRTNVRSYVQQERSQRIALNGPTPRFPSIRRLGSHRAHLAWPHALEGCQDIWVSAGHCGCGSDVSSTASVHNSRSAFAFKQPCYPSEIRIRPYGSPVELLLELPVTFSPSARVEPPMSFARTAATVPLASLVDIGVRRSERVVPAAVRGWS